MGKKILITACAISLLWILSYLWYKYYENNWTRYEYDDNWNLITKYHLKRWELHWEYIKYFSDWKIQSIANFVDGDFSGEQISYYDNWNLQHREYIKPIGGYDISKESVRYYYDWQLERKIDVGWKYTEYYQDGTIFREWNIGDKWYRVWNLYQYDESWKLIATMTYKDWEFFSWEYIQFPLDSNPDGSNQTRIKAGVLHYEDWRMIGEDKYYYDELWNLISILTYKNWEPFSETYYKDWKEIWIDYY